MTPIQAHVQSLIFVFKGLEHETDGFAWDYTAATDDHVLDTKPIAHETIEGLSNIILKIIKPSQRRTLKKQIAYLIGLRHRQQEVWAEYMEDCQTRTNNTNQWVQQHTR